MNGLISSGRMRGRIEEEEEEMFLMSPVVQ